MMLRIATDLENQSQGKSFVKFCKIKFCKQILDKKFNLSKMGVWVRIIHSFFVNENLTSYNQTIS